MLVACDVEMLIYTVMFRFDIGAEMIPLQVVGTVPRLTMGGMESSQVQCQF
jgi:hypothetical protein